MVAAGIIELTVAPRHTAETWARFLPELVPLPDVPLETGGGLSWLVRKGNPELKSALDAFVTKVRPGTLLGNIYYRRYFETAGALDNPLGHDDYQRFSRYAPLFRKYGAMYDIDWMLLAAVAYQESGMNPTRRSPRGAVGLMQVLPSTARTVLGIADCLPLENNIHAGAKYLAHLRDTYFDDPQLEPMERMRLTLAAYNAGPYNIRKSRRRTAKLGRDPNVWFGHCELGTMQIVGRETVRYVSNISKYYLAYTMAQALECMRPPPQAEVPFPVTRDAAYAPGDPDGT